MIVFLFLIIKFAYQVEQTIGETDEKLDENPWIVEVFWKLRAIYFICFGSLISNQHVLVSDGCAEKNYFLVGLATNGATPFDVEYL